ncbi:MAG: iron-sulfur cluster repair di-iron protein [Rhodobacteraceae bacterium]|jgi:regulator of cell morphogenesis and NO signaling|nr:iron-sulfur cluster repair di-iron protein [Paracoccaceae bacterium]
MTDLSLQSRVGDVAASLPGAAGLFRRQGISFCCGAGKTLAETAAERGIDADRLLAGLVALRTDAAAAVPEATDALIAHILGRYHATHRAELDELIPLAAKVETVHGEREDAPAGLSDLLVQVFEEMDEHMTKEEHVLFPMMLGGGHPMIVHPIAMMRHEHDSHAEQLRALEHLTNGFVPPAGACRSWQALYAGLEKFASDLVRHMHLENEVLFPRFEGARG